jgi:hybrid cluster-associated redox disulfide protein
LISLRKGANRLPRFTKETNIQEILNKGEVVEQIFRKLGLKCIQCVAAEKETLQDAARYHGIPVERIINELEGAP